MIDQTKTLNKTGLRENNPEYLILHSTYTYPTFNELLEKHRSNGWSGVGYHIFVSKDRKIHQARPFELEGAHALGFNTNSIGLGFYNMNGENLQEIKSLVSTLKGLKIISHTEAQAIYMNRLFKEKGLDIEIPLDEDLTSDRGFKRAKEYLEHAIGNMGVTEYEKVRGHIKQFKNCPGPSYREIIK